MFQKFWDNVSEQLPTLKEQFTDQINQINQSLAPLFGSAASLSSLSTSSPAAAAIVTVGPLRVRILKKLGEGGYSYVYLAEEVPRNEDDGSSSSRPSLPPPPRQQCYALKKVLAGELEQLEAAKREIKVMQDLPAHPNLLPLLEHAIIATAPTAARSSTASSAIKHTVYMLFPLMDINLWDYVQDRHTTKQFLSSAEAFHIVSQLCSALEAMHTNNASHRDVKPHNILLTLNAPSKPWLQVGQKHAHKIDNDDDSAHLVASPVPHTRSNRLPIAALMDFGSAGPATMRVTSRSEALTVQEDAERHTTAPYRAPELWDVPSSCTIDCKIDIWATGCVLYYLLVGSSPFERTANEAGGSLMLAIVNGQYTWPRDAVDRYDEHVRGLVDWCLKLKPEERPTAGELLERITSGGP